MALKDPYHETADESEALERYLFEYFQLDEDQLRRAAVVLLVHTPASVTTASSLPSST